MTNISQQLTEKLQERILFKETDGIVKFYSPVHSLYLKLNDTGIITSEGIETDIKSFTNQETPLIDETFRMYQQAFLKPPPVFSRMNLELTRSCTLHCPHCFIEHKSAPETNIFNEELIPKLIQYSPSEISLTGGEIFLVENLEDLISKIVSSSSKKILFRLLANGSWFLDKNRINKTIRFIKKTGAEFQFRFTLFHYRKEIHDLVCGSSGIYDALFDLFKRLDDAEVPYSVNFPLTSFSFDDRFNALDFLHEKTSGNYSISSIIYPSQHAIRHVQKFSLTEDQFKILLGEKEFRPLASAYCDPSGQCMYHCRFPLFDSEGRLYSCNLPGTRQINISGNSLLPAGIPLPDICSSCKANKWCKKCPSSVPEFSKLYCPLARIAAERVNADYEKAVREEFRPV